MLLHDTILSYITTNNPYPLQFENIELLLYDKIEESHVFYSFEQQSQNIVTVYMPIELYQLNSFDQTCAYL